MTRFAGVLFVGLIVLACGPRVAPTAQTSSAASPTRTQLPESTPTPTSSSTQDGITASVTCVGGPGAAMTVVAGAFLYEVLDPLHPRLVCRSANTVLHLLDGNAVAYTAVVDGHVVIVRRDLTTGAESRVAQLRLEPHPYYYGRVGWTWDGLLEVYATSGVPSADGRWLVSVHLWSDGADHVLYAIEAGPGGLESRWSPRGFLAFSQDHAYLAITDFPFYIYGENVRIFSIADQRQKFVTAMSSSGGTWIGNDRFLWAPMASSPSLMQWTPIGGAKLLRSEAWYGATSSSDGLWLAGTLLTDSSNPRALIVRDGGLTPFTTAPGSSPGFVTQTVVWYAEEGPDTSGSYQCVEPCSHPTTPDGTVRAFDATNGTDRVVSFRVGEEPKTAEGFTICCLTSG
jgi:hypothetical protein